MCENYEPTIQRYTRNQLSGEQIPVFFVDAAKDQEVKRRDHRYYCGGVASCVEAVHDKIMLNHLALDPQTYLKIAGATNGKEGLHFVAYGGSVYSVTIRGQVIQEERSFGIVRTVLQHGPARDGLVARLSEEIHAFDSPAQINRRVRHLIKAGN